MKYAVSYRLLTHDSDGPIPESREYEAESLKEAYAKGERIAQDRAAQIRKDGGVAEVSNIHIKRFHKRASKKSR